MEIKLGKLLYYQQQSLVKTIYIKNITMALINNISNVLGLGGATPQAREGASATTSKIHVDGTSQKPEHSVLDLDGKIASKYTDNLPK